MFHALGGDESVGEQADAMRFAAHHQNFEAIIMVEMNVERRNDQLGVVVLHIGEQRLQTRLMMVEKQGDGARDLPAHLLAMLDQLGTDDVGQALRTIRTAFFNHHHIQIARHIRGQRNTETHSSISLVTKALQFRSS